MTYNAWRTRDMRATCLVMLWAAVPWPVPAAADGGHDPHAKVREGLELFEAGEFHRAAEAFQQAQVTMPGALQVKFDRACALQATGEWEEATQLLQEVAAGPDERLASGALYNLGCAASAQARELLGAEPGSVAVEQRELAMAKLTSAATHWRRCLDLAPGHSEARYNLELMRSWITRLQQLWQAHDRQQLRETTELVPFVELIEQRQLELRRETRQLATQGDSVSRRMQLRQLAARQRALAEELPPLAEKIVNAVTRSLTAGEPLEPQGAPASGGGQAAPSPRSARLSQIQTQVDQVTGAIAQQMEAAAKSLQQRDLPAAQSAQLAVLDQLDETYAAFAPLGAVVQKAIHQQESLVTLADPGKPIPPPPLTTASQSPQQTPNDVGDGKRDYSDEAWQQRRVSQWSAVLPPKAAAILDQFARQESPQGVAAADPEKNPQATNPPAEADDEAGGEADGEADGEAAGESDGEADDEAGGKSDAEAAVAAQFRVALQKAIKLGPQIEKLARDAAEDLQREAGEAAAPKQQRALELLRELAAAFPRDPQHNQEQDQTQQQDQQQDPQQGADNSDSKQTSPPPGSPDQQSSAGSGQSQDRTDQSQDSAAQQQQGDQPPASGDQSRQPAPDAERSPSEDSQQGNGDAPQDAADQADAAEQDSREPPQGESAPHPPADEQGEPINQPSPPAAAGSEDAQAADGDRPRDTRGGAVRTLEQREREAILAKVRQQERRYREAQKRLRALIYGPTQVDKDW